MLSGDTEDRNTDDDASNSRTDWTAEENELLQLLLSEGKTNEEITAFLPGRSAGSIQARRYRLRYDKAGDVLDSEARASNDKKKWRPRDFKSLHRLWKEGATDEEIGEAMGRSPHSIQQKRSLRGWTSWVKSARPKKSVSHDLPLLKQPAPTRKVEHLDVAPLEAHVTIGGLKGKVEGNVPLDILQPVLHYLLGLQ